MRKNGSRLKWSPSIDAEIVRLRKDGSTLKEIGYALRKQFGFKVSIQAISFRCGKLGPETAKKRPRTVVPLMVTREEADEIRKTLPFSKRLYISLNKCSITWCAKQRADGCDKCTVHLLTNKEYV